jgi:hypothetical protein
MSIDNEALLAPLDQLATLWRLTTGSPGRFITQREANLANRIKTLLQQLAFGAVVTLGPGQADEQSDDEALVMRRTFTVSIVRNV